MNISDSTLNFPPELPADIEDQKLISTPKFILFSILSFGLYDIWWMFKEWSFFQQKDKLNIRPVLRAVFCIFFLYSLFQRIQKFAHENQYSKTYSSWFLFLAYILTPILIRSIDPYHIMSLMTILYLIPAFQAINYAKRKSISFKIIELKKLTTPQIILVVIGSIFWLAFLISFLL